MAAIDFTTALRDLDGTPLHADGKRLTLGGACIGALSNPRRPLVAKTQIEDCALAKRILGNDTLDLSAEDIVKLKERIEDINKPVLYAQACELLDPKPQQDDEPDG